MLSCSHKAEVFLISFQKTARELNEPVKPLQPNVRLVAHPVGATVFWEKRDPKKKAQAAGYEPGESPDDLKKIIGELTVQNEILKKASRLLGGK